MRKTTEKRLREIEGGEVRIAATGSSTARALRDHLADARPPEAFGADPTGVADSTAAIQAAVDAAGSKRVVFRAGGIYRTTATIDLGSGSTLSGYGATIKPDNDLPVFKAQASADGSVRLSKISIVGLHIDGTNRPGPSAPQGGWGAFRFFFVDDLTVRDVSWYKGHDGVYLRGTQDFTLTGLRANDMTASIVTLLLGTKRGIISDIQGIELEEVIDLYSNEDVSIANVRASGRTVPGADNEAFDVSTVRRVTISNAVVRGFPRGIQIKTEAGVGDGSVSWEDITFRDVHIFDNVYEGIKVQAAYAGYTTAKRLRMSGVTINSAVVGSSGFLISPPVAGGYDVEIDNANVSVPGVALDAYQWQGFRLRGSKLVSTGTGYAARFSVGVPMYDLTVTDCELVATGGVNTDAALYVSEGHDVQIERNVVQSTTGAGILLNNCMRPVVSRNRTRNSGRHAISLTWNNVAKLDIRHLATVTDNVLVNFGQESANRAGVNITVSSVSASLEGLSVARNTTLLTDSATQQSQIGILAGWGTATLGPTNVSGNIFGVRVPTRTSGIAHAEAVSTDRGDTSQTLTARIDAPVQRWATALSANRTVTLSTTGATQGDVFRVVRTGLGAFTLDVGGLKTIPSATAATVEVTYSGSAWILTGYQPL